MTAWMLAVHYWREAIRGRLVAAIFVLSAVFMALACLIGPLSLGTGDRIVRDVGLVSMLLSSIIVLVAGGCQLIAREIEGRAIFLIVTRPISRGTYLLGRFTGLVLLGWAGILVAWLVFAATLLFRGQIIDAPIVQAAGFAGLEVCVIAMVVVFFATVAGPVASMMYSFGAFAAGHAMQGILASVNFTGISKSLMTALSWTLPDLSRFDMRIEAVNGHTVGVGDLGWAAAYAAAYGAALFLLAWASFSRRELE